MKGKNDQAFILLSQTFELNLVQILAIKDDAESLEAICKLIRRKLNSFCKHPN